MKLNHMSPSSRLTECIVPLMIAVFTASAKCLTKVISCISLLDEPVELLQEMKLFCADKVHSQLRWRQYFQVHDTPSNVMLDGRCGIWHSYEKLKDTRWRRSLASLDKQMDSPHLTKIVQFYSDELQEYPWMNPAVVSYYYGNTLLCRYDVFVKLKNSLRYVTRELDVYGASKYERNFVMQWILKGNDFRENPLGEIDERLFHGDILHWLRVCDEDKCLSPGEPYSPCIPGNYYLSLKEVQEYFPGKVWNKVGEQIKETAEPIDNDDDDLPF